MSDTQQKPEQQAASFYSKAGGRTPSPGPEAVSQDASRAAPPGSNATREAEGARFYGNAQKPAGTPPKGTFNGQPQVKTAEEIAAVAAKANEPEPEAGTIEETDEEFDAAVKNWDIETVAEHGAEAIEAAREFVTQHADDDALEVLRQTGLGSHPAIVRLAVKLAGAS